jgi:hypothetical protein
MTCSHRNDAFNLGRVPYCPRRDQSVVVSGRISVAELAGLARAPGAWGSAPSLAKKTFFRRLRDSLSLRPTKDQRLTKIQRCASTGFFFKEHFPQTPCHLRAAFKRTLPLSQHHHSHHRFPHRQEPGGIVVLCQSPLSFPQWVSPAAE